MDIEQLIKRRDQAASRLGRLHGRLDAANAALRQVEEECAALKISPPELEGVILKLQAKIEEEAQTLAASLDSLEENMRGYESL